MPRIRILMDLNAAGPDIVAWSARAGDLVDRPADEIPALVESGYAEALDDQAPAKVEPEAAVETPEAEKAVEQRPRRGGRRPQVRKGAE